MVCILDYHKPFPSLVTLNRVNISGFHLTIILELPTPNMERKSHEHSWSHALPNFERVS